jgi:hypothetical protein
MSSGAVIKGIHLVGSLGRLGEAQRFKPLNKGLKIVNFELDLDFALGRHVQQYRGVQTRFLGWPAPSSQKLLFREVRTRTRQPASQSVQLVSRTWLVNRESDVFRD